MKVIMIDDERDALEMLEIELKNAFPDIEVIGKYQSPVEGVTALNENPPDILFIDIQMPILNGFDVLKRVHIPETSIIFLTAYADYAIEAIKAKAADYLLKPIDTKELVTAVTNAQKSKRDSFAKLPSGERTLQLPMQDGVAFLKYKSIIMIKAESNYARVITLEKEVLVSKPLKFLEEKIDSDLFIRCHKSFLVNRDHIISFRRADGGFFELTNGHRAYIARGKKDLFFD